ncbi:hypothetical protein Pph01_77660 [Planotetraspora phitsanulokensis]|uniref:Uncharacterized protein n=2 Tax=Planotetraspora phitsanulokensis TaxID=575192 RepID=A0A8J3UC63_9ACTN|nr:hypothetical protein Pph01_77660 [Planotetraspora phitsanulokensis]
MWHDVLLISHTKSKYPVLCGDGTTRVEVARTVRVTRASRCEKTPVQYGDTVKTTFDHMAGWLTDHYVS